MVDFDRRIVGWIHSRCAIGWLEALSKMAKSLTLVQLFGSRAVLSRIFPFPHSDARNLVELKYVAGHDLLQWNNWSGFELAGCPALSA